MGEEQGKTQIANCKIPVTSRLPSSVIAAALPFALCVLPFDLLFGFCIAYVN
jgi:hypothetical protein